MSNENARIDTRMHTLFMKTLHERMTLSKVEQLIVDEIIASLESPPHQVTLKHIEPPKGRSDPENILAFAMRIVEGRWTMTELLSAAFTNRSAYKQLYPLFCTLVRKYKGPRTVVASFERIVSYRTPSLITTPPKREQTPTVNNTTKRAVSQPVHVTYQSCHRCHQVGHHVIDCKIGCIHCGKRGHTESRCTDARASIDRHVARKW
jgi:hypothetical protein